MLRFSICQRNKSRGILFWYVRIFNTETKELRYESLGTDKKTEAKDLLNARIKEGYYENEITENKKITLKKAIENYLMYLENKGATKGSIKEYQATLNSLSSLFNKNLQDITKIELTNTFLEQTQNNKGNTKNRKKTIIKSVFKYFANVLEVIPKNIAESLPSVKYNPVEKSFWTLEQINRILDKAPNKNYRLLWAFMAFAGLRIHEAIKVKKEDIRDGYLYVLGKGNKLAKVPVCERLYKELDKCKWAWEFSKNMRLNIIIKRYAKKALPEGFEGVATNHRFRHSFASNLIRAGVSPKHCQKLLRHANINTTLNIYSHLLDEDLEDSIEKMFK